jgi:hypothetical protein
MSHLTPIRYRLLNAVFIVCMLATLAVSPRLSARTTADPAKIINSADLGLVPTEAMIDLINQNYIRFRHQSVGGNTLNGLAKIVINGKQVSVSEEWLPNNDGDQKVNDWKTEVILSNTNASPSDDIDIAVFKWCFINEWDANFDTLTSAITEINSHTSVKIIIFTMPLLHTGSDNITAINNQIRTLPNLFSNVWVYDIADVESTHADGTLCISGSNRFVCPEYRDGTDDHPGTEEGETRVGKGFFVALYEASKPAFIPTHWVYLPLITKN